MVCVGHCRRWLLALKDLAGVRCAVRSAGAPTLTYATSRLVGHLASFGLL